MKDAPKIHPSRGRIPKSKWSAREPIIKRCAGIIPDTEIAAMLGISRGCLSSICSKRGISLRVPGRMSRSIARWHQDRKTAPVRVDINKLWRPTSLGTIS